VRERGYARGGLRDGTRKREGAGGIERERERERESEREGEGERERERERGRERAKERTRIGKEGWKEWGGRGV